MDVMNHDNDYLWDRSGPEDPDVKRLESLLGVYRLQQSASPLPVLKPARNWSGWLFPSRRLRLSRSP
jgi:hypothetical protein